MKLATLFLCLALSAYGADAPLLVKPGKVISAPDLKQSLGPEWSVAKGKWEPAEGVLKGTELPDEHHAAVLHLNTGPAPLVFECEFRMDTAKVFYIGCDGKGHVGRLVIVPKSAKLAQDAPGNPLGANGKPTSQTLAEAPLDLKPGDWQKVRVEFAGDRLAAVLNGAKLEAQHPHFATPKVRWWFAVGGGSAEIRNIRVAEGTPLTQP
jgi:hypothetical protein